MHDIADLSAPASTDLFEAERLIIRLEADGITLALSEDQDLLARPAAAARAHGDDIRRLREALRRALYVRQKTPRFDERYALEVVHQAHRYVCRALEGALVEVFDRLEAEQPAVWQAAQAAREEADAAARAHNHRRMTVALDQWAAAMTEGEAERIIRLERERVKRELRKRKKKAEAEVAA